MSFKDLEALMATMQDDTGKKPEAAQEPAKTEPAKAKAAPSATRSKSRAVKVASESEREAAPPEATNSADRLFIDLDSPVFSPSSTYDSKVASLSRAKPFLQAPGLGPSGNSVQLTNEALQELEVAYVDTPEVKQAVREAVKDGSPAIDLMLTSPEDRKAYRLQQIQLPNVRERVAGQKFYDLGTVQLPVPFTDTTVTAPAMQPIDRVNPLGAAYESLDKQKDITSQALAKAALYRGVSEQNPDMTPGQVVKRVNDMIKRSEHPAFAVPVEDFDMAAMGYGDDSDPSAVLRKLIRKSQGMELLDGAE